MFTFRNLHKLYGEIYCRDFCHQFLSEHLKKFLALTRNVQDLSSLIRG